MLVPPAASFVVPNPLCSCGNSVSEHVNHRCRVRTPTEDHSLWYLMALVRHFFGTYSSLPRGPLSFSSDYHLRTWILHPFASSLISVQDNGAEMRHCHCRVANLYLRGSFSQLQSTPHSHTRYSAREIEPAMWPFERCAREVQNDEPPRFTHVWDAIAVAFNRVKQGLQGF